MKVLKHRVLIEPKTPQSVLVQNLEPDRGEVIAVGLETEVKVGDTVIFGPEYEKLSMEHEGISKELLLMYENNINIFFDAKGK